MDAPVPSINILLIESDPATAESVRIALAASSSDLFHLHWVLCLSHGIDRLNRKDIDAVLLQLALPDSHGIHTFDKVYAAAPDVPILILGGNVSDPLAKEAVSRGAQDYLLPDHLEYYLPRALNNAIERRVVADALFLEKERAQVTLNSIGDAVLCTDVSGNITYLNLMGEAMTGWSRTEALGKPLAEVFRIIDNTTRQVAADPMEMAVSQRLWALPPLAT